MSRGAVNSSLGIVAMVGMAVVMSHSGMTNLLAQGLSQSFGKDFYPAIAPFIGALGAFITGSNNNSNVLFAALQMRTAELLQLSVTLILAAQTAGGSLGSIMAPAKVIVGCSTVGLGDHEGVVMRPVLGYGNHPGDRRSLDDPGSGLVGRRAMNKAPQPFNKRYRLQIQMVALLLGSIMPFVWFAALQAGQGVWGGIAFALIVIAVLLTAWVG